MKLRGTLGFALLLYATALLVREHECAVAQSTQEANVTSTIESVFAIPEEDDDFVPYQGERFSVFDWMLFRAMGKKYPGNILMSPVSIKMALVLLYEGAQDQTAHELSNVMQLPASRSATRDKFSSILTSLQAPSTAYTLNVGTRLYVDANVLTRQRYEAIVKTFYNTDVITANLSNAHPIVENVNTWVSNITSGSISKMIEDEDSIKDSVMLIMNAMFFKGTWQHRYFKPEDTRVGQFYVNTNETVDVPFMHAVGRFYYSESPELDAKILRIPYAGHKFAMYLILPSTRNGAEHLMSNVNPFILTRHVWLMQDLPVDVYIPKFKFEFSSHLESTLRELGIRDIFDDTAMLTGIARTKRTSRHLQVSDILQKTGIEMNENGTTAQAATEIHLGNKIEDETFQANHPFVFYIEDETTGTVLFVGKVANPLTTMGSTVEAATKLPTRIGGDDNTG